MMGMKETKKPNSEDQTMESWKPQNRVHAIKAGFTELTYFMK
jgi:hypothetical protein